MVSNPGDNRTVLISALIAIPAACLISMLVHYFVPAPTPEVPAVAVVPAPMGGAPFGGMPGPGPDRPVPPEEEELTALYRQRVELAKQVLAQAKDETAAVGAAAEAALRETALYRHLNHIRARGFSATDLAIRAEAAAKLAALAKDDAARALEAADLALQLKSSRGASNPAWQEAFAAWKAAPSDETLHAMIDAEQAAMPPRPF